MQQPQHTYLHITHHASTHAHTYLQRPSGNARVARIYAVLEGFPLAMPSLLMLFLDHLEPVLLCNHPAQLGQVLWG